MSYQEIYRGALMVAIVCLVLVVRPVSTVFSRHCPTIYNHNETTSNSFEIPRTLDNTMDRYGAPSLNEATILSCSLSSLKPDVLWNNSGDLYFDWDRKLNDRKLQQKANQKMALHSASESYASVKRSRLNKDSLAICEQKKRYYGNCSIDEGRYASRTGRLQSNIDEGRYVSHTRRLQSNIDEGRYASHTRRLQSNSFHEYTRNDAAFNMSFWHREVDMLWAVSGVTKQHHRKPKPGI